MPLVKRSRGRQPPGAWQHDMTALLVSMSWWVLRGHHSGQSVRHEGRKVVERGWVSGTPGRHGGCGGPGVLPQACRPAEGPSPPSEVVGRLDPEGEEQWGACGGGRAARARRLEGEEVPALLTHSARQLHSTTQKAGGASPSPSHSRRVRPSGPARRSRRGSPAGAPAGRWARLGRPPRLEQRQHRGRAAARPPARTARPCRCLPAAAPARARR